MGLSEFNKKRFFVSDQNILRVFSNVCTSAIIFANLVACSAACSSRRGIENTFKGATWLFDPIKAT